jgi:hypothetical protein
VLLVGVLADRSGGYALPFTLTGALGIVAAGLVLLSGRQPALARNLPVAAHVAAEGEFPRGGSG